MHTLPLSVLTFTLTSVLTSLRALLVFWLLWLLPLSLFLFLLCLLLSLRPPLSSLPPVAPVPVSSSLFPSTPPVRFHAPSLTSLPSSTPSPLPPVFSHSSLSLAPGFFLPSGAAPEGSAVAPGLSAAPVSLSSPLPPFTPLFCPFAADPAPSTQVLSAPFSSALHSAPSALDLVRGPSFSSSAPLSFAAASSSSFVAPDELPEDVTPDVLPQDEDSEVPESVRSEFLRMLAFLVDLFPQTAGSHSAPPPRALFEDFFGSSTPPSPPIYLSWFERVRMALADARLASFLSSGRSDFFFLPPRNSSYPIKGDRFGAGGSGKSVVVVAVREAA